MRRTILTISVSMVAAAAWIQLAVAQQVVTWTGASDFTTFEDAGNWSPTPTGGIVDPAALIDNYVIDDGSAIVQASATLTFDSANAGGNVGLTVSNGAFLTLITPATGITGDADALTDEVLSIDGGFVEATFLSLGMHAQLDAGSLTLLGTGDPLNNATLDFGGNLSGTMFSFETPADFIAEHVSKITVNGARATVGANLTVVSDGGTGSIVTAMEAPLLIEIDRGSGSMTLTNVSGSPIAFESYSIASTAGGLDGANWTTITGNYDADGDRSVDSSQVWTVTSQTPLLLAESESPIVDGGMLTADQSVDLGSGDGMTTFGPWLRSPFEDLQVELTLAGGVSQPVAVEFTGNGGEAYRTGDYDLDNDVDAADWAIFRGNLLSEFPGLTEVEGYFLGDLDGDFDNDENDFVLFEALFDAENGAGAFAAMLPEPSALMLLLTCGMSVLLSARRRRSCRSCCPGLVVLLATSLALMLGVGDARAAFEWTGVVDGDLFNEANWLDTVTGSPPPDGAIDPAVDVNNDLFINLGMPLVDAASFAAPLQLGEGGSGTLTMTGGVLDMVGPAGANGIRAAGPSPDFLNSPVVMSGTAMADLQFILDIDMSLLDEAMVTFQGGGAPVNRSTVEISSENALVYFTNEDLAAFVAEHLQNFTSFGEPAVLGINLEVTSDGASGVFVRAIPSLEPLKLEINASSGVINLVNDTGRDIDLDFYKITGGLDVANWNSLQDQNLPGFPAGDGSGNGWEEAGGSDDAELGEAYLLDMSTFTDQLSINLGSAYDESGDPRDVAFRYRDAALGVFIDGNVEYVTGGVDGDFNGDGQWDLQDINALVGEIAAGTNAPSFDMNGDGVVDRADITDETVGWLAVGGANNPDETGGNPFLEGDANLDGSVDVSDFNAWNGNKFTPVPEWSSGDFTADGTIDVSDFNTWNGNKFESSNVVSVPEPLATVWVVLATAVAWACRRRERSRKTTV